MTLIKIVKSIVFFFAFKISICYNHVISNFGKDYLIKFQIMIIVLRHCISILLNRSSQSSGSSLNRIQYYKLVLLENNQKDPQLKTNLKWAARYHDKL